MISAARAGSSAGGGFASICFCSANARSKGAARALRFSSEAERTSAARSSARVRPARTGVQRTRISGQLRDVEVECDGEVGLGRGREPLAILAPHDVLDAVLDELRPASDLHVQHDLRLAVRRVQVIADAIEIDKRLIDRRRPARELELRDARRTWRSARSRYRGLSDCNPRAGSSCRRRGRGLRRAMWAQSRASARRAAAMLARSRTPQCAPREPSSGSAGSASVECGVALAARVSSATSSDRARVGVQLRCLHRLSGAATSSSRTGAGSPPPPSRARGLFARVVRPVTVHSVR